MIIPEYDNPDPRLSWEPLPCPWYLPSVKQYRFQIGGSSLGYKITTYRYSDGNILFNAASVMIAAGTVYGFTQSILWSVAIGIPLLVFITAFSWIQLRYMPHFDLPGRFFYRGIAMRSDSGFANRFHRQKRTLPSDCTSQGRFPEVADSWGVPPYSGIDRI